jgi:hypothetical protein
MEHWWFQHVVGFDRADQLSTTKRLWLALRGATGSDVQSTPARSKRAPAFELDGDWRRAVLGPVALAGAVMLLWRVRRRRSTRSVPPYYDQALRLLSRRGLVRAPETAVREFAQSASKQLDLPAAKAFSSLTECYLEDRFGGRPPLRAENELRTLRRALRTRRSRVAPEPAPESRVSGQR